MLFAVLTFLPAAALIVLAPGPDTLLVLRNSARGGRRAGLITAAGTVTGLLVWAGAAALGLAALVRASEVAYTIVRWCGAAYLIFLGTHLLWHSRRPRTEDEEPGSEVTASTAAMDSKATTATIRSASARRQRVTDYFAGVGTNLFNPKVGVFFVSFLPVFIPRGSPVALTSMLLGAIFLAEASVWLMAIVMLGNRLSVIVTRPRVRRRLERLTGLVMVGFGVRLAFERR